MSKDFVVRLFFKNGTHEQVKYESKEEAMAAFEEIDKSVDQEKKIGEVDLPDGTRFCFRVSELSHWKVFKYTPSAKEYK
jgi:hypothetical protein